MSKESGKESNAMQVKENQRAKVVSVDLLIHSKDKNYLVLTDSRTSATVASSKVTSDGKKSGKSQEVQWDSQVGTFITKRQ